MKKEEEERCSNADLGKENNGEGRDSRINIKTPHSVLWTPVR